MKVARTIYRCRHAGCDAEFTHAPARAAHEKTHPPSTRRFTFDNAEMQRQLAAAAQDTLICRMRAAIKKNVATRTGEATVVGKKDGRVANSGASVRTARPPAFKMRVIVEYERISKQYPDFKAEAAALTAESFNINQCQLSKWLRQKAKLQKEASRKNKKNDLRSRKQRGKFAAAEQAVYDQFLAARKEGKRVGPRWLKQCARREVARMYLGTPLEVEAKKFGAKRGWLSRFCSRWSLSLRRKTNVKNKSIEERLPKIKRYFALFRLRLQSYISGQIIFNNKVGGCEINVLTGVVLAYSSRGYITLLSEQNFLLSSVLVLFLLLGVSIKSPSCGT